MQSACYLFDSLGEKKLDSFPSQLAETVLIGILFPSQVPLDKEKSLFSMLSHVFPMFFPAAFHKSCISWCHLRPPNNAKQHKKKLPSFTTKQRFTLNLDCRGKSTGSKRVTLEGVRPCSIPSRGAEMEPLFEAKTNSRPARTPPLHPLDLPQPEA